MQTTPLSVIIDPLSKTMEKSSGFEGVYLNHSDFTEAVTKAGGGGIKTNIRNPNNADNPKTKIEISLLFSESLGYDVLSCM